MKPDSLAVLPFGQAAPIWLDHHSQYIEERTRRDYVQYIRSLDKYFRLIPLKDLHIGHVYVYQRSRKIRAGASRVNMEMSTLQQVLRTANLWAPFAPVYRPLPVSREGSGKPYTSEQKAELIRVALDAAHPRWHLTGHCLRVMLNSGVGFGELRHVRRRDFDPDDRTIWVCMGAKNKGRRRRVPLNDDAFASMVWIMERWRSAGGIGLEEYLLYHRARTDGDPPVLNRPMGEAGIRSAFTSIRKAAGLHAPAWKGHRIYDCRVTFITEKLASGEVNVPTLTKVVGHVGEQMIKRYYKPDLDTMREVVNVGTETRTKRQEREPSGAPTPVPSSTLALMGFGMGSGISQAAQPGAKAPAPRVPESDEKEARQTAPGALDAIAADLGIETDELARALRLTIEALRAAPRKSATPVPDHDGKVVIFPNS